MPRPALRQTRASGLEELLRTVSEDESVGYDHRYLHQIGPDQAGFFRFWERELQPALADR